MKKLSLKNTALVVVDMQSHFLKNFDVSSRNQLVQNQLKVIQKCIKHKVPIVVLEFKCRGCKKVETIDEIKKKTKGVVTIIKENNGGFTDTNLNQILKNLKCRNILLIGINANGCVQDTAIGALHRGYGVITSKGLIANSSQKDLGLSRNNEKWYSKNTLFFENTGEFAKALFK